MVGAGAVEGAGFVFDAEDDVVEVAAGGDEGVCGSGGGGVGGDGVLFGVTQGFIGGLGGFTAVGRVVGLVVGHGAECVVGLDVLENLLGVDADGFADVFHDVSVSYAKQLNSYGFRCYRQAVFESSEWHILGRQSCSCPCEGSRCCRMRCWVGE